jgi:hypothetical protein
MVLKDRLRKLDAHSSVPTEFRVYTASGAILSVVTIVIVLYLLVTEAYFNFQVTLEERVHVSATSPDGLELEFDLTLPHVPCQYLNVDANDPAGQSQSLHLDQEHHVWKHRLKYENGKSKLIGARKKLELGSTLLTEGDLIEHMEDLEEEFDDEDDEASTVQDTKSGDKGSEACGSCYGAGEEGECCDTCDDVQRAYRRKGWVLQDLDGVKQCKGGAEIDMAGEGCNVHGVVALSTGGGNLHLAPGKQSRDSVHPNVLDLLFQSMQEWNVTHTLHKIRFGPHYPAATYQLDQQMRSIQDNYGMYQYYFKVGCDGGTGGIGCVLRSLTRSSLPFLLLGYARSHTRRWYRRPIASSMGRRFRQISTA